MLQPVTQAIPADAVREAVRGIAQGREYHRSLRTSLFDRVWKWFNELLERLFSAAGDVPNARMIGIVIITVI
ncbi:MAG: hypothetical protein H0X64_05110, partial [Gemmatimonadaceae bacterium]|nr:hypothetical protein [Gemmatimonadaceae bacterium]